MIWRVSPPSLAQRAMELERLGLPNSSITISGGRELQYRFAICPSDCSRAYHCVLKIRPGLDFPEVIVVSPNLKELADGKKIPHIYPYKGSGTKLCLWWPKQKDWKHQMKLAETYIPWTAEWLWYFEDWLSTGEWAGGGEHPAGGKDKRKSAT